METGVEPDLECHRPNVPRDAITEGRGAVVFKGRKTTSGQEESERERPLEAPPQKI